MLRRTPTPPRYLNLLALIPGLRKTGYYSRSRRAKTFLSVEPSTDKMRAPLILDPLRRGADETAPRWPRYRRYKEQTDRFTNRFSPPTIRFIPSKSVYG